jgi:hypothetical protein
MSNLNAEPWDQDFLDVLILAEKNALRLSYLAIKKALEESGIDPKMWNSSATNLTSIEEQSARIRWSLKRNYYHNLSDYGLTVNVRIKAGDGKEYVDTLLFSACVKQIDRRGFEDSNLEFWPPQFETLQKFKDYLSNEVNIEALLLEDQPELAA